MQEAERIEQHEEPAVGLLQKRHQTYSVEQPREQQEIYI